MLTLVTNLFHSKDHQEIVTVPGIHHSIMQNIHTEGIILFKNHQGLECSKGRQCWGTES
jgi:hypothetical protein